MRISDWSSDVCSSDCSFRYQPLYPKPIPLPNRPGKARRADGTLDAGPLGYVHGPEDRLVDEQGQPRRIDHAFSWAYPLSAHGMMHTLIRNAHAGDPSRIDTLLMFKIGRASCRERVCQYV